MVARDKNEKDFLARRLYDMTAEIIMSLLIIADASKAPELFADSANVYVRMAEEHVIGKAAYIQAFRAEDLAAFEAEKVADEAEIGLLTKPDNKGCKARFVLQPFVSSGSKISGGILTHELEG